MDQQSCPRCQAINDPGVETCRQCGLNLELFEYIMNCLQGRIPQISSPVILEPGESAYFASPVTMQAQKTETSTKHYFLGTRVRLAGMPVYLGQSTPAKESHEILAAAGSGEFVLTNRRIVITSDKQTFSLPLSEVIDFEHAGGGIQIFAQGRHGGIIYQVERQWQLWILLFSLLKSKSITPTNEAQADELRHFALHICEHVKGVEKTSERQEWVQTVFHSDISTCLWTVIVPPLGLYLVWKSDFSWFHKIVWTLVGLYSLGRWSMFFQGIAG